jgi:hypothetical protein
VSRSEASGGELNSSVAEELSVREGAKGNRGAVTEDVI